ncbi:AGE family epimerase/isomerase [Brevundimonas sp. SL130]|uniref:AGE family epimerase/isomerase n=1 Tax=Brevundimonas sp. SL130 TaxID=2995143 RepID=UPI00226CA3FB|nr:AGE family epimerase/isomerase [Brevundimonas sp. SL130]WAC59861.1 AGE family epimerase/isomerase [Brevundimonas sp. SL130]
MNLYPVIMCGGAGTRLWPASRPSRPKQFIPLSGNRSLFQETVLRVAPLADTGGRLIVVGGVAHREAILAQLAELGVTAQILLEPEARDSAAAMAVAAAWTVRRDPNGVNIFVASDHHIPDYQAFRTAAERAAEAAQAGLIVTLGVTPTEPSSAYGYIAAEGEGLSAVKAFVEKPDRDTAERYIADGYLWNSGNFIVSAATLLGELQSAAPAVEAAAREALPDEGDGDLAVLGAAFRSAPKISIDYAVMEKTKRASVLAVDFEWSDLGAWDAVAATGEGDLGSFVFEDAEGCMARAPEGMVVAAIGVRNLAIIAERDAVLVCDLSRSQDVKKVVERLKLSSPQHLDFARLAPESLLDGGARFTRWLNMRALPIWSALGQSADGAFAELLGLDGRQVESQRRARVQARQVQVFADAGRMGWHGPWREVVQSGLARIEAAYLRPDGLMRTVLAADGSPLDETPMLYDQAFHLFALASAVQAGMEGEHEGRAKAVRDRLLADAPPTGGLIENGAYPFQSNCHMHLLEAALAWEIVSKDAGWSALSDRIVTLARQHFIDAEGGFLREFFAEDWSPAAGDDGRLVEPGHQFEWAWLLARYGRARGDASAIDAARKLYAFGLRGVGPRRQVAVDAMDQDGAVLSRRARLWPQTEWLKASLILAELSDDGDRTGLLEQAAMAQRALWRYLTDDGLWRDKLLENGQFIDEPAPASSFYHIMAAWTQLQATSERLGFERQPALRFR